VRCSICGADGVRVFAFARAKSPRPVRLGERFRGQGRPVEERLALIGLRLFRPLGRVENRCFGRGVRVVKADLSGPHVGLKATAGVEEN
jgi:hypothetical protein